MILVDTNVVVGLFNPLDQHNKMADNDLRHFDRQPLAMIPAVLAEAVLLLPMQVQRTALREWLHDANVQILCDLEKEFLFGNVFDWLEKYADHQPDWADGCLSVISGMYPKAKVWTYDSEFKTIWRRPDGSHIPLAV